MVQGGPKNGGLVKITTPDKLHCNYIDIIRDRKQLYFLHGTFLHFIAVVFSAFYYILTFVM